MPPVCNIDFACVRVCETLRRDQLHRYEPGFSLKEARDGHTQKQTSSAQLSRINTVSFPLSSKSHLPPDKPLHLRPASSPWQIRPIRPWYSGVMWQHWCLRLWSDAHTTHTDSVSRQRRWSSPDEMPTSPAPNQPFRFNMCHRLASGGCRHWLITH